MKPEYIGIGNFDENNYVYGHCRCPLSVDYAIKWPRIKDGKPHRYSCVCEDCGTEVGVWSKSYGPEILEEQANDKNCYFCKHYKNGYCGEYEEKMTMTDFIYNQIKEVKKQRWIPVSEKLPEKGIWVLAYCKTKDGYEYQTVLLLSEYNDEWTDSDDFCDDVIAWMPLPEPYKESEKENENMR